MFSWKSLRKLLDLHFPRSAPREDLLLQVAVECVVEAIAAILDPGHQSLDVALGQALRSQGRVRRWRAG